MTAPFFTLDTNTLWHLSHDKSEGAFTKFQAEAASRELPAIGTGKMLGSPLGFLEFAGLATEASKAPGVQADVVLITNVRTAARALDKLKKEIKRAKEKRSVDLADLEKRLRTESPSVQNAVVAVRDDLFQKYRTAYRSSPILQTQALKTGFEEQVRRRGAHARGYLKNWFGLYCCKERLQRSPLLSV